MADEFLESDFANVGAPSESDGSWFDDILGFGGKVFGFAQDNPVLTSSILGGIAHLMGANDAKTPPPVGYQGGIPKYTYNRQQIQHAPDPNRRPGSAGRRYFTDGSYSGSGVMQGVGLPTTGGAGGTQPNNTGGSPGGSTPGSDNDPALVHQYAKGGGIESLMQRGEGRYLDGDSNGQADKVDAVIDGQEPAKLSDGEYVIPADVVAHLGGGNNKAGAKVLDNMLARVRQQATGNKEQAKPVGIEQAMPENRHV